jgi:hypothetical protein
MQHLLTLCDSFSLLHNEEVFTSAQALVQRLCMFTTLHINENKYHLFKRWIWHKNRNLWKSMDFYMKFVILN